MSRRLGRAGLLLALLQPMAAQPLPEKDSRPDRQPEPYFTETRPLTSLSFSARELVDLFNRRLSRNRLVLILSSTLEEDLRHAAAVEDFLKRHAEENWSVVAIWTAAQPTDSLASSLRATSALSDRRVEHFHDPSGLAAQSFALRLGYPLDQPVRGLLLGFRSGQSWDGLPPQPLFWMHSREGLTLGEPFSTAELEQLAKKLD